MPFEIIDEETPVTPERARAEPVDVIMQAIGHINTACLEGKQTTNHTDWGRLQEMQRLAERMRNICEVMRSGRPSGAGAG